MNSRAFLLILLVIGELVGSSDGDCKPGEYWNRKILRCQDCTTCGKGERLISLCQGSEDASCEICPKGTYLDVVNKSLCVQCSYCRKGQVIESECEPWSDTQCGILASTPPPSVRPCALTQPFIETTMGSHFQGESASKKVDHASEAPDLRYPNSTFSDEVSWFLLVCLVLVSLWCCFLIFLIKWNGISILSLLYKAKKMQLPNKPEGGMMAKVSLSSASRKLETSVLKENGMKFRTTTAVITEKLAQFLNIETGKNYKSLAGLMGYDVTFIGNLKLTPTEATQRLLQDWQTKDDATVFKLYCYLKELGRQDAMGVLYPLLTSQGSDCAMV